MKKSLTFNFKLKKIDKTSAPCQKCALRVGIFGCMSRKDCEYTDDKPEVYIFDND